MFVGIDPSLTNTAIVWLDGNKVIFHHIIKTPPTKDWKNGIYRIRGIITELTSILYPNTVPYIHCVVLEGYSYGSRFQSHQLGELGYALRDYLLGVYGELVFVVPPKTLVKFVTGNGNSKKKDVANKIKSMGIELPTEHHYDACSCALFGKGIMNNAGLSKLQRVVLEKYLGSNK